MTSLAAWPTGVPTEIEVPAEALGASLDRAAARFPERVATSFLGSELTYAELQDQVQRAAAALQSLGVRAGDRVAIVLPNSTSHMIAFYAVLRLGAIVVEHNPTYTAAELRHQIADSGSRFALVWTKAVASAIGAIPSSDLETVVAVDITRDMPFRTRVALRLPVRAARETRKAVTAPVPDGVPEWHDLVSAASPLPADHPWPDSEEPALLQYTGGTTGTPKAAVLLHRNLVANALQGSAWTQAKPGNDTIYAVLPFFHAFGLTLCLGYGVLQAATIVMFPKFDPVAVLSTQRKIPCTFLPAVPPMLDRLSAAAGPKDDLSSFRYAICGAMALPPATAKRWEELTGGLVIEGYGMTETSPVALGSPLSEHRRPGTLGMPFPSTKIRVVDLEDPDREVAPGEKGELLIQGPQVFAGYWNRPEETAQQLLPGGWVRTGDVVRVEEDGFVVLADRIKEMIVTGGFKVYPSQVEEHLRQMPGIRDVAVVGLPAGDLGEKVVAAIVLAEGELVDLNALREWGEQRLARYALPRELHVVAELPRSIIGKVLRRVVREDIERGGAEPGAAAEPDGSSSAAVAADGAVTSSARENAS